LGYSGTVVGVTAHGHLHQDLSMPTSEPLTTPSIDHDTDTDAGKCAHIIKSPPHTTAAAWALQAMVEGLTVEALCGWRWVPSGSPGSLPVCARCRAVYDMYRMYHDHLGDNPDSL
jgi:hypothetical protein